MAEEAGREKLKVELVEELKSEMISKNFKSQYNNFDLNKSDIRPDAAYELAKNM
jgi:hypothetical protein